MDLAHNTARLVCCVYEEGEYNTCVGPACTSSIELTCSRTCANCAWVCICKRRCHAHTTIRFLIGISRIAYRLHGHGTWACTRPSLAHNTARLVCMHMMLAVCHCAAPPASARPARPRSS